MYDKNKSTIQHDIKLASYKLTSTEDEHRGNKDKKENTGKEIHTNAGARLVARSGITRSYSCTGVQAGQYFKKLLNTFCKKDHM